MEKGFKTSIKSRRLTRDRVARWRDKQKEVERTIEEAEQQEQFDRDRQQRGLVCFGETRPLKNASNIGEEIEIASEMSVALGGAEFTSGDVPRAYIAKVFHLWLASGCLAFDREAKKFDPLVAFEPPDFDKYVWPADTDTIGQE